MDFKLPEASYVNKFIPKGKFFERSTINTKLKKEFTDKIQRITRKYKLAESTISTSKTDKIEEIQIFEIQLKKKTIPKYALQVIDKIIPYPILYTFVYQDNIAYGVSLKEETNKAYYLSERDQEMSFDFNWINLEKVYQNIIKAFITKVDIADKDFDSIITKDQKIKALEKEIQTIRSKIKREKQMNRKVELNKILLDKKQELTLLR